MYCPVYLTFLQVFEHLSSKLVFIFQEFLVDDWGIFGQKLVFSPPLSLFQFYTERAGWVLYQYHPPAESRSPSTPAITAGLEKSAVTREAGLGASLPFSPWSSTSNKAPMKFLASGSKMWHSSCLRWNLPEQKKIPMLPRTNSS